MPNANAKIARIQFRPIGYRPRRRPLWGSREAFFSDAALFILAVAGLYSANVVGALPGCEILLFPVLPVALLAHGKRAFSRQYLMFYLVAGGWLIGTILADTFNGIGAFNRAKGTARVIFFVLDFVALAVLINNKARKIVVFALGLTALSLVGSWQFSGDFQLQWKFGVSQAFATLALLVSSYFYVRRRYWACFWISLVLAGLNLHYGFRSQLIFHVISVVLILPLFEGSRGRAASASADRSTVRVIMLLALAGGGVYAANFAIQYGAQKGIFDEATNAKFQTQSKGDYGVLVGGRPETLVAIQAIRDSPIIGHGSFPFGLKYMQMKQDIQYEHGYSDSDEPEDVDYPVIPTHSHLTMAWVEGGILGGACWIYILVLTLRALVRLISLRPPLAPLYSYLLINFVWDILYSPFGSVNRMHAAFLILLSYFILRPSTQPAARSRPITKTIWKGRQAALPARLAASSAAPGAYGGRP
jgi:hypothetical protein